MDLLIISNVLLVLVLSLLYFCLRVYCLNKLVKTLGSIALSQLNELDSLQTDNSFLNKQLFHAMEEKENLLAHINLTKISIEDIPGVKIESMVNDSPTVDFPTQRNPVVPRSPPVKVNTLKWNSSTNNQSESHYRDIGWKEAKFGDNFTPQQTGQDLGQIIGKTIQHLCQRVFSGKRRVKKTETDSFGPIQQHSDEDSRLFQPETRSDRTISPD